MSHLPDPISNQTSNRTNQSRSLFLMLCLISLTTFAARGYSQQSPCINQSPRDLTLQKAELDAKPPVAGLDYNYTSATPVMNPTGPTTVQYQGITLYLCDRHYHVPVENRQGCTDEKKGIPGPNPPDVNQWIEFHSVYAQVVDTAAGCAEGPDRDLACCKTPPFVVRAFSAKVTGPVQPPAPPITQPTNGILAEWTGSNTGPDNPVGGCKPLPAQWSFRFGCQFTLSQTQLERGFHPHGARPEQPPRRLSPDLTVVGTAPEQELTCREVETPLLHASDANTVCQAACKNPLNLFTNGDWKNVPATNPTHGLCKCCPLPRPQ